MSYELWVDSPGRKTMRGAWDEAKKEYEGLFVAMRQDIADLRNKLEIQGHGQFVGNGVDDVVNDVCIKICEQVKKRHEEKLDRAMSRKEVMFIEGLICGVEDCIDALNHECKNGNVGVIDE